MRSDGWGSGITALGMIWGQYLTSGIAGKLYVTSTPEQKGPSPLLTRNASCQRAAIGQMGAMIIIPSRISRSEYDTNADKGDELYDKCGQVRLPDSTLDYALVLTMNK